MPTVTTKDGTSIFYKDWGMGRPVVFSHGWPLNADVWDPQLLWMASNGFRVVAHDRRGHGRSSQPWGGNTMDDYADDLAAVFDTLDLHDAVLVGHSTGGGEVVRYLGRHGSARVSKVVLLGAIPPLMLQTADNPAGTPIEAFDDIRAKVLADRSQFYADLSAPFFGANRPGAAVSQGVREHFWLMSMQVGLKAAYDCIRQFSESDFDEDLRRITVPMLVIHGDDDQIVPIDASARLTVQRVASAELKVYPGAPHGLFATHAEQFNADLLDFVQARVCEPPLHLPIAHESVEAAMTSGRQNHAVKVSRPENAITAELPSQSAWEQSASGLKTLGVDVDQAIVLHGPEGVRAFDVNGAEQGWWARAIRSWTNLGGQDANVLASYDGALRAGRYVVQVPVVMNTVPEDIAAVIGAQGGTNTYYYRHGILSRLG
jgi:non-heme chloroperoxidase